MLTSTVPGTAAISSKEPSSSVVVSRSPVCTAASAIPLPWGSVTRPLSTSGSSCRPRSPPSGTICTLNTASWYPGAATVREAGATKERLAVPSSPVVAVSPSGPVITAPATGPSTPSTMRGTELSGFSRW